MKKGKKPVRLATLLLCVTCLVSALAGCGSGTGDQASSEPEGPQSEINITEGTTDGVLEGAAATEMVDKVVATISSNTLETSPFSPPSSSMTMKPMMYATLIYRDYYGAPLEDCSMWVAKSVTKVDDLTYDIELYDYVTDNQGNNINADDVIFSYEKSAELAQFTNARSNMESLTKTGEYSLQMKITKNAPGVIEDLLSNAQLYIVDQEWYENATDEERRNNPAVTGAYRLVDNEGGSTVTLEAVENYWQQDTALRPIAAYQNVKTIVFKGITEGSMRLIALENGEVDVTSINNSDLSRVYADGAPLEGYNVTLAGGNYGFSAFLNMDSGKSVLADNVDLRRAVLYAMNSEDVMYATGADEYTGVVIHDIATQYQSGFVDAWNDQDYFNYDPEKAAEYLEAAGYKPGEVTLRMLSSSTTFTDSVRAVLIANLEEAGFKVDSLAVDQALFNTYKNDSTQWDIMLDMKGSSTGNIVGVWDYCFNPVGYENGSVCFTHDEELVRLLEEVSANPVEENMTAFHNYLIDQAICKGLYTYLSASASQDGILELKVDGTGVNVIVNALVFAEDYQSVAG
ncbi:ABC transporter substrate-binding protein [Ruthenibacterium lactatiformans]|uniref:ABC transporter substrate-binding protein n=1 Tax=Ruthenibacterium lactatiformans TaxID=1550024 RepID=UPI0032C1CEFB